MIDPRNLIGMTEGAKKRAARFWAGWGLLSGRNRETWKHVVRTAYATNRKLYRVGERLRPCPWIHDDLGCKGRGNGPCDGSGVIVKSAKRRNEARFTIGIAGADEVIQAAKDAQRQMAEAWQGILQEKINDICAESGYPSDLTPRVIIKVKP